jgi:hypothetical protein
MLRRTALVMLAGLAVLSAVAQAKPADFTANATQTSDHTSGRTQKFAETLRVKGKVIGTDKITCVVKSATVAPCTATFTLKTGVIRIKGTLNPAKQRNTFPIVGGSGRYAGAKGTLHLFFLSSTRATETFDFS